MAGKLPKASFEERLTITQRVTQILREAILSGQIEGGRRLAQDEVAEQLGVSRVPVREAFQALQGEGLLNLLPHRGAVVTKLSIDEVREIFEIRAALESLAIEKAMFRLTEEDFRACEDLITRMEGTHDAGDWLSLNAEFHSRLYRPSEAGRLLDMIQSLRRNVERYLRINLVILDRYAEFQYEHRAILQACRQRNTSTAGCLLRAHLLNSAYRLEELVQARREAMA